MRRLARRSIRIALATCALGVVAAPAAPAEEPPAYAAPTQIRGALVLEPSRIAIGEVARLELAVATPPGYAVREAGPRPETPGFWVLTSETLPLQKEPGRWLHRTRLRIRAREVGRFAWPDWPLVVEGPDGAQRELVIEGRAIEVVSVLPDFAGREGPFGLRAPRASASGGDPLVAAAVGAAGALALVGLVLLVRRERRRRAERETRTREAELAALAPAWEEAGVALDAAAAEADPHAAAGRIARALRRYLARRFGVSTEAFTTDELAAAATPFVVRSRWPRYLALLAELDALRFPPAPAGAAARVAAAVAEARDLVADSTPRDDGRPRPEGSPP
ncbi:MAG TPA: hypothetical protein VMW35_10410 [Myxococcota bacterium]|nr:hypothetical protein [Myxococcota bacterium]